MKLAGVKPAVLSALPSGDPAYDPLLRLSGVLEIWDASETSGMTKSSGGSISSWVGRKGAYTISQGTGTERPDFSAADANGRPMVRFQNDRLTFLDGGFDPATLTVIAVIKDKNTYPINGFTAYTFFSMDDDPAASRMDFFHANGFIGTSAPMWRVEGSSTWSHWINAVATAGNTDTYTADTPTVLASTVTDVSTTSVFGVGGRPWSTVARGNFELHELILCDSAQTQQQLDDFQAYAQIKWAVPV